MLFKLTRNLHLSRVSGDRAKEYCAGWTCAIRYVHIKDPSAHRSNARLYAIRNFCDEVEYLAESMPSEGRIVACPVNNDAHSFDEACLFLGSYLILNAKMQCHEILSAFREVDQQIEETTLKCWHALDSAIQLDWLVHPDSDIEPIFDTEEFAHYASPAQGRLHMAVPGALYFFPTPDDLLGDQEWADHIEDGRTVRVFGAHFYAELFQDMGLSLVVCLGSSSAAAAAAFGARGIETVDLDLAADGSSLLRGLDRLLSLAREAPGAVAVHSGDGFEWPAYAGTLSAAFMISRFGLEEGAAKAWLGMVVPWMVADVGETTLVRP